jgi:hypothetical protein
MMVAAGATCLFVASATPVSAWAPVNCYWWMEGVDSAGVPQSLRYNKQGLTIEALGPGSLGYVPRDIAYPNGDNGGGLPSTGPATFEMFWFTLDGPNLREVTQTRTIQMPEGANISTTYATRVMSTSWSGVRQIAIGKNREFMYGLTANGLVRYRLSGEDGAATVRTDSVVATTGWAGVRSLTYSRTVTWQGSDAEVFLALTKAGGLVEYIIPLDDPTKWVRKDLRSSSWQDVVAVSLSGCDESNDAASYTAVTSNGDLYLYSEANGNDFRGDDIRRVGRLASPWSATPYNL